MKDSQNDRKQKKFIPFSSYSLGRADVTLRHAKGKIAENTVYACALLSAHGDTHGTKGKKGMISRMFDQANISQSMPDFRLISLDHNTY